MHKQELHQQLSDALVNRDEDAAVRLSNQAVEAKADAYEAIVGDWQREWMPFKPPGEGSTGHFKGLFDPKGWLSRSAVSEGDMDGPAGLNLGHGVVGPKVRKLPRRITAVTLDCETSFAG